MAAVLAIPAVRGARLVEIVRESVIDVPTALLAIAAFAVLYRYHEKLTVLYVVVGCGLAGLPGQRDGPR